MPRTLSTNIKIIIDCMNKIISFNLPPPSPPMILTDQNQSKPPDWLWQLLMLFAFQKGIIEAKLKKESDST